MSNATEQPEKNVTGTATHVADGLKMEKELQQLIVERRLLAIGTKYKGTDAEKLRAEARDALGVNSEKDYNFAFTGQTGVGKSTLINCILGYDDSNPKAAAVGIVETTSTIQSYRHESLGHLVLWDMPGGGTQDNPQETYFVDKRLYVFDCLLVIMSERMVQVDLHIARLAEEFGTPVIFVRNKALAALSSMQAMHPHLDRKALVAETKRLISENTKHQLAKAGLRDQKLFIIEAHAFRTADFVFDELALMQHVTALSSKRA